MDGLLYSLTYERWEELMAAWGQPRFRAQQIFSWLHKGQKPTDMNNIPRDLRIRLAHELTDDGAEIVLIRQSLRDETEKYLFELRGDVRVEGVRMVYRHGDTLCISSQAGCRMGCLFCASTQGGLERNLTAGEMIGQIVAVNRHIAPQGRAIHNVVVMGSGEPLDNIENLLLFLELLEHPNGLNIGRRSVSISTCGLPERMIALADSGFHPTLSLSLHAPNDEIRARIMKVAQSCPIEQVMEAAKYYVAKTKRRLIVEYVMIRGVNDQEAHARELSGLLRGWQNHVNLIPLNAVGGSELRPSGAETIKKFLQTLERLHISATIRRTMGADIEGACGQLRRRYAQQPEQGD